LGKNTANGAYRLATFPSMCGTKKARPPKGCQVELLLKSIKHHLRNEVNFGTSENSGKRMSPGGKKELQMFPVKSAIAATNIARYVRQRT
jgi:hypothetical protein